ncbi:MAG: S-adenosylmethionine decarboxylase [Bacteroidetes bacterium]|nr:S-adenosylmethionine decarboxylase [Bacteroidota bacterium]
MKDLMPKIFRQRLIIEGIPEKNIGTTKIKKYLQELSKELEMKTLLYPVTHKSEKFGWAGWIHWETSGAHFYAWEKPELFFSVDIYTCKKFSNKKAVDFTRKFFKTKKIVWKSV